MAKLFNHKSNEYIILRSLHLFGRHSGNANTVLTNPEASRLHASIQWNGSVWLIQDTSSNGTFINKKLMAKGKKIRLTIKDAIQFGTLKSANWVFIDNSPPKSLLVSLDNKDDCIELDGIVVLPSPKNPIITLYQLMDKQWVYEDASGMNILQTGIKLNLNDGFWYFVNADTMDETKKTYNNHQHSKDTIKAVFTVSQNEEHVEMFIHSDNQLIDLGERIHHYLILTLARKRLKDFKNGIEEIEQGWIDKNILAQQIGMDENHINILIFRFRKQFLKLIPPSLHLFQLIERRRGNIRFAIKNIEINGGLEG